MDEKDNIAADVTIKEGYEISVFDSNGNRMQARSDNDVLMLQDGDKVLFNVVNGKVNIVMLEGDYKEENS